MAPTATTVVMRTPTSRTRGVRSCTRESLPVGVVMGRAYDTIFIHRGHRLIIHRPTAGTRDHGHPPPADPPATPTTVGSAHRPSPPPSAWGWPASRSRRA